MRSSPAVRSRIEQLVSELERMEPRLIRCRVLIDSPHRHQRVGRKYHIRIELTVPGRRNLVINREPSRFHPPAAHEELAVALQDAFAAAKRKLEEGVRLRRGMVKEHAPPEMETGRVIRVVQEAPEEGGLYGFIQDPRDGAEVYFHEHSVVGGRLSGLKPGVRVNFTRELGDEGPQAARVEWPRAKRARA